MDNKPYGNITKEEVDKAINEIFNREEVKLAFNSFNVFYNSLSKESQKVFNNEFKRQAKAFISDNIYTSVDIKDGKQCANCDVRYERPHWTTVLCVDCFEEMLKEGKVPEFQKASGVEL